MRPAGRAYLEVEVLYTLGKESGYEAVQRGEQANICKARYLHGTLRRRSDRHKREGACAIPGEIWRSALCY